MNSNEYHGLALRTKCPNDGPRSRFLQGIIAFAQLSALAVSLGQQMDQLKAFIYYGKGTPPIAGPGDEYEGLELSDKLIDLVHAGVGMFTEAAEFIDALRAIIFQRLPIDEVNLREEAGDTCWYVAVACYALGAQLGEVQTANIAKLRARFPMKYSDEKAAVRDFAAERIALVTPGDGPQVPPEPQEEPDLRAPARKRASLSKEIAAALNRHSAENGSNTPDFILGEFLLGVLGNFDKAVSDREYWYGRTTKPVEPSQRSLQIAAQAWCFEETKDIEMDGRLATAFAKILDDLTPG